MYQIFGIDIGNYATKVSNGYKFTSKCAKTPNILNSIKLETDEGTYYIGDGAFDLEYRKAKKEYIRAFFTYALSQLNCDSVKCVVGLPISQYQDDREEMQRILRDKYCYKYSLNDKQKR